MIFSNDNLQAIASGGVVGATWPYDRGSEDDIESYLKTVVAALRSSKLLEVDAEFAHYGSGFASFVHAFCYKRNHKSTVQNRDEDIIDGIAVYLGRLAPVAAYGPEQRTKNYRRGWFGFRRKQGSTHGFLEIDKLNESPPGDWREEISEIVCTLRRFGFILPSREELSRELPFAADIQTNLGGPALGKPYLVFDALFHWYD